MRRASMGRLSSLRAQIVALLRTGQAPIIHGVGSNPLRHGARLLRQGTEIRDAARRVELQRAGGGGEVHRISGSGRTAAASQGLEPCDREPRVEPDGDLPFGCTTQARDNEAKGTGWNIEGSAARGSRSAPCRTARGSPYGRQVGVPEAAACMKAAWDEGVNFFDNAEAYAARPGGGDHGGGAATARLAAGELPRLDEDLLRHARRAEREGHAQPQEAPRGDRRSPEAFRARLHRPRLLPPPGPRDAGRGDGLVHAHDGRERARPSTGARRNGTPTRSGRRGGSRRSTTSTSRRWSSRSTTCSAADRWRRNTSGSTRGSAWGSRSGARWRPGF